MKTLFFFIILCSLVSVLLFACKSNKPKVIVLLGAPGAGKGTQSVMLTEKLGIPQISTGDLFREHLKKNTAFGEKAKEYMNAGKLVPDELVLSMLFERISAADTKKGFILDGFPRTIAQAEALDRKLEGSYQIKVVSLTIADQTIIDRLTKRVVCSSCGAPYHLENLPPKEAGICDKCGGEVVQRPDDQESVIRKRLDVFHEQTEPVIDYYQKKGWLTKVDTSGTKEQTFAAIMKAIKN